MTTAARACPASRTPLPEEAHFCLHCGTATPTEPGVPPRTAATDLGEIARMRTALGTRGYAIERVRGEGGMATVYLATDVKHRRQAAVKVMRPDLAATLGAERFLREVEIAAQLNHPNVLPGHDSGDADGVPGAADDAVRLGLLFGAPRIDPNVAPPEGNPRFEKLLQGT